MDRELAELLRSRALDARRSPEALDDVCYALARLHEAAGDGDKPPWLKKKTEKKADEADDGDGKKLDADKKDVATQAAPEKKPAATETPVPEKPPADKADPKSPGDVQASPDAALDFPPGRVGTLMDLKDKAEKARESHDAEQIAELTDALVMFLDAEIDESTAAQTGADDLQNQPGTPTPEDPTMAPPVEGEKAMPTDLPWEKKDEEAPEGEAPPEGEKPNPFAKKDDEAIAEADGEEQAPPDEEELARRKEMAEADGFARYAGPARRMPMEGNMAADTPRAMACEACGHAMNVPTQESEKPETAAAGKEPQAEPQVKLQEAERAELIQLRTEKRAAQRRQRCREAIKKASAEGYVLEDELITFEEAQWPTLISRWMGPSRAFGGGERPMPAPRGGGAIARSAVDAFKAAFDADPDYDS